MTGKHWLIERTIRSVGVLELADRIEGMSLDIHPSTFWVCHMIHRPTGLWHTDKR